MKLRKLQFNDNRILGNLKLDFINPTTNVPYDTILLVGENGVGKTTILTEISDFLSGQDLSKCFNSIEYAIGDEIITISSIPEEHDSHKFIRRKNEVDEKLSYGWNDNNGSNIDRMNQDELDPRHYGSVISLPRSDFQTKKIDTVGVSELDLNSHEKDVNNDFTSLKQLLVDLNSLDSDDFTELHRQGNPITIEEFEKESRMSRFTKAFNHFFEDITYSCVRGVNGQKEIYFKKFGKEIPIDSLSTGEKQIVFRGIYLLRNLKRLIGGVLLIDEPELSLHPKWQNKILKYYQTLFTDTTTNNMQVQLIVATHSERILSSAFEDINSNGVLIIKNNGGVISAASVNAPGVLPTVTSAETTYLAYEVATVDYHIELFSHIQRSNATVGELNVKETDDYILNHQLYNAAIHERQDSFTNPRNLHTTIYMTLPTFIRNRIDHPNPNDPYSYTQLQTSIELMRKIIQNP